MKNRFMVMLTLLNMFIMSQANATEFSKPYTPKGMDVEFKVPLDEYLTLLADSSGYSYVPSTGEFKCKTLTVPFNANIRGVSSKGKLNTVYDYLSQVGFFVPDEYIITVRESEKSITLICYAESSNLIRE